MTDWCNAGFMIVAVCSVMLLADPKLASPSAGIGFVFAIGMLLLQPWRRARKA